MQTWIVQDTYLLARPTHFDYKMLEDDNTKQKTKIFILVLHSLFFEFLF